MLLPTQYVMHQMAKLMEKRRDVANLHETGISGRGRGKIADQCSLRELFTMHAVEKRKLRGVTVLARPRMHVQIKAPDRLAVIEDVPGFNGCLPRRRVLLLAEGHVKEFGRRVEDALLDLLIGEVGPDRL